MTSIEIVFIAFFSAVGIGFLSGISGGGGGMLMIPLYIFLGLSPQQAIATGKMNGIGSSYGGLSEFAKSGHVRKDLLKVIAPIAVIAGVTAPFVFVKLDGALMQQIVGVLLIVLVPTLFIKKKIPTDPTAKSSRVRHFIGYVLYGTILFVQSIFGAGVGSLALFVLRLLFGASTIEANATKRAVTAIISPISVIALLIAGYVVLAYGIAGMAGAYIGAKYGSRYVMRKDDKFASVIMASIVVVSGILLVSGAS